MYIKKINIRPNVRNIVVHEEIAKTSISYQESSLSWPAVQTKFTLKINAFSGRKRLSFITQYTPTIIFCCK